MAAIASASSPMLGFAAASKPRSFCVSAATLVRPRLRGSLSVQAAKKQQQPKKRKDSKRGGGGAPPMPPISRRMAEAEYEEDDNERFAESRTATAMPSAPEPGPSMPSDPASEYRTFAPKPAIIEQVRPGSWSWDDGEGPGGASSSGGPAVPEWNPRTGFMGAVAEGGSGAGSSGKEEGGQEVQASLLTPSAAALDGSADLPAVSKDQILSSCLGTGFWMTAVAFLLRQYGQANAPRVLGTDPKLISELLQVPSGFESWENVGVALGAVVVVTAARLQLMNIWPDFRMATNRSNKQVLEPLGWSDILLVAIISGFSEEALFRGAVIPASFPDWRGALISGAIFGILHNNGGRNLAFAAWASAVGALYGGLFVYTHNIWVPITAHAAANFCSAAVWKSNRQGNGASSSSL